MKVTFDIDEQQIAIVFLKQVYKQTKDVSKEDSEFAEDLFKAAEVLLKQLMSPTAFEFFLKKELTENVDQS